MTARVAAPATVPLDAGVDDLETCAFIPGFPAAAPLCWADDFDPDVSAAGVPGAPWGDTVVILDRVLNMSRMLPFLAISTENALSAGILKNDIVQSHL